MSNNRRKWLSVPEGWGDVLGRSLIAALIAFVALNLKELAETGAPDIPASALDGVCIAVVTFLFYAILSVASPRAQRAEEKFVVN